MVMGTSGVAGAATGNAVNNGTCAGGVLATGNYNHLTIAGACSLPGSGKVHVKLGIIRDNVHGNVTDTNNTMADPDANEIVTNRVWGNLACSGNSPAAQVGDSEGQPNKVAGTKSGECAAF